MGLVTTRATRLLAGMALVVLALASCGDDGDAGGAPRETAPPTSSAPATSPPTSAPDDGCTDERRGGSMTVMGGVLYGFVAGVDPIVALGASAGATELNAFYDTLIRYDPSTATFEPHLAVSLEPDDDHRTWTIQLREDVRFGNGDPLTAEAVRFSVERLAASPRTAAGLAQEVASMEIVDDTTITFTLRRPWAGFPYLFAHAGGMVVNPRVVAERGADFPKNPRGAGVGPYEFVSFTPNEELVLRAKDDYWGGPVCIEELRFVSIPDSQTTYEAFQQAEIDVMFLPEPNVIAQAKDAGVAGEGQVFGSNGFWTNSHRGTDLPFGDVRLRRAAAHAMDLDLINQRVYGGTALMSSALTHERQVVHSGLDGPAYDPDLARQLVAEVKATTSWDGAITIVCRNTPEHNELALVAKGLLDAVGFSASIENLAGNDYSTRVFTDGRFDMACAGAPLFDEAPIRGVGIFEGGSPRTRTGFADPRLDAALQKLYLVAEPEEVRAVMREVQEVWNDLVPSVWLNAGEWWFGWHEGVHGIVSHIGGVALFHDAWIER